MSRIARLNPVTLEVETITSIPFALTRVFSKNGKLLVVGTGKLAFYDPSTGSIVVKSFEDIGVEIVTDVGIGISGSSVVAFDENGIINTYEADFTVLWASRGGGQAVICGKGKMIVCNEDLMECTSLDVDPNAEFKFVYCNELGYCIAWAPIHSQSFHGNQYSGPDWVVVKNKSIYWYIYYGFTSQKYSLPTIPLGKYIALVYEQNNARTNIFVGDMETKQIDYKYYVSASYYASGYSVCSNRVCIGNFDKSVVVVLKNDGNWSATKLSRSILSGSIIDSQDISYIFAVADGKGYVFITDLVEGNVQEEGVDVEFQGDIFIPLRW